jgi:hypothetical protein
MAHTLSEVEISELLEDEEANEEIRFLLPNTLSFNDVSIQWDTTRKDARMNFIENGLVAHNSSDGYRTFLTNKRIPENSIRKMQIYLRNTYGRNLDFGISTQQDDIQGT